MSACLFARGRRTLRRYGVLLLLLLALVLGCLCALLLRTDAHSVDLPSTRESVLSALTSVRSVAVTALIYFACFLIGGLSIRLYGACLFVLGLFSGVCAQLLCGSFGDRAALLILWIFLPRLLLLCFCSVRLYSAESSAIFLCTLWTAIVFALQALLYPIFLAPGFIS